MFTLSDAYKLGKNVNKSFALLILESIIDECETAKNHKDPMICFITIKELCQDLLKDMEDKK